MWWLFVSFVWKTDSKNDQLILLLILFLQFCYFFLQVFPYLRIWCWIIWRKLVVYRIRNRDNLELIFLVRPLLSREQGSGRKSWIFIKNYTLGIDLDTHNRSRNNTFRFLAHIWLKEVLGQNTAVSRVSIEGAELYRPETCKVFLKRSHTLL